MRNTARLFASTFMGGMLLMGACADPPEERAEVGLATGAITHGARDFPDNAHRWAVGLSRPSPTAVDALFEQPDKVNCSGTLVSPTHILTAKHCFGSSGDNYWLFDDHWNVHFHEHPEVAPPEQRRNHGGPAILYMGRFVYHDAGDDLALLRVWPRVPPALASPKQLPTAGQCPASMSGAQLGFAARGPKHGTNADEGEIYWVFDDSCFEQDPLDTSVRRSSWVSGFNWTLGPAIGNAHYVNAYAGPSGEVCAWFNGGTFKGDSGGPLLTQGNALLCGVASSHWWIMDPIGIGNIYTYHTATDSSGAAAWLASELAHPTFPGLLKGQCPIPSWSEDADGDGIHDACDDCPLVFNDEQDKPSALAGYDADLDGIGNACDTCPAHRQVAKPDLENSNFEAEFMKYRDVHETWLGYPPERPTGPQVQIRKNYYLSKNGWSTSAAITAMNTAKNLLSSYPFRADICDPNPSVTVSVGKNPDASLDGLQIPTDYLNMCGLGNSTCNFIQRTKVKFAVSDSTVIEAGSLQRNVGLRWCQCHEYESHTLGGRLDCEEGPRLCVKDQAEYTSSTSKWLPLQTFPASNPSQTTAGVEFPHTFGLTPHVDGVDQANWDFRNLPVYYENHTTQYDEQWIKGVLWASWFGTTPAGVSADLRHGWGDGNAYYKFSVTEPEWVMTKLEIFCLDCEWGVVPVVDDLINPYHVLGLSGAVQGPHADGFDELSKMAASGAALVVSLGDKEQLTSAPAGATIGLTLEAETGTPLHLLKVGEHGAPPVVVELHGEWGEVPEFSSDAAMALSAHHRVAVVAGGTFDGLPNGEPNPNAWMLSLDDGVWTALPEVDGSLGHVLDATYSAADEALWFVNVADGRVQIGRWTFLVPSSQVEPIAVVPESWPAIEDAHLLALGSGALVVAFRLEGGGTRAILFTDLRTTPTYRGALGRDTSALRSPLPGRGGIVLAGQRDAELGMERFTLEDFDIGAAPPLDTP
jgi:hypothetical protein